MLLFFYLATAPSFIAAAGLTMSNGGNYKMMSGNRLFFLFFYKNREAGAQISPLLKPSEPPDQIHAAQPNGKCVSQTEFKSAAVSDRKLRSRPPPSQPTVGSYFFYGRHS